VTSILLAWGVRSALLLGIALVLVALMRRAPAAWRHGVLVVTIACALALPVLSVLLPPLALQVLPAAPKAQTVVTIGGRKADPVIPPPISKLATPTQIAHQLVSSVQSPVPVVKNAPTPPNTEALILFAVLGVSLSLVARAALGYAGIAVLLRRTRSTDRHDDALVAAADIIGVHKPVRVRIVNAGNRPTAMTWGWRKPIIILPHAATSWSDSKLEAVLLHELAHVKRNDWIAQQLGQLAAAVLWFNPFAWFALKRLKLEAELSADDMVVGVGLKPSEYATHLLEIATSMKFRQPSLANAGVTIMRSNCMETRLRAILDPKTKRAGFSTVSLLVVVALAAAAATPLAMTRLDNKKSKSDIKVVKTIDGKDANLDVTVTVDGDEGTGLDVLSMSGLDPETVKQIMEEIKKEAPQLTEEQTKKIEGKLKAIAPKPRVRTFKVGDEDVFMGKMPVMPPIPNMDKLMELGQILPGKIHKVIKINGKDYDKMSPEEKKKFEAEMEKFGEEMGKWGEGFGKDWEKWGEEYGKQWEEFGKQFEGMGNPMIDTFVVGKEGKPSPEQMAEMMRSLRGFEGLKNGKIGDVSGVMDSVRKSLEDLRKEMSDKNSSQFRKLSDKERKDALKNIEKAIKELEAERVKGAKNLQKFQQEMREAQKQAQIEIEKARLGKDK